jgi:hypothetical protein
MNSNGTSTVKLDGKLTEEVRRLAKKEHRTLRGQIEVLIRSGLQLIRKAL